MDLGEFNDWRDTIASRGVEMLCRMPEKKFWMLSLLLLASLIVGFSGQTLAGGDMPECEPPKIVTKDQIFIGCSLTLQKSEELNEGNIRSLSEAIYSKNSHKNYKYGTVFWVLLNPDGSTKDMTIVPFRNGKITD